MLVITALVASVALGNAASALAITVSGAISATDPGRTTVTVTPPGSTCATAPVAGAPNSVVFPYDTYSFTNTSASAQCVTVAVTAAAPNQLLMYVYAAGSKYVAAPGAGLLGATGNCRGPGSSFQFSVPTGQTFLLVVSSCTAAIDLPETYTLDVTGTGLTGGAAVAAVLRGAPTATAGPRGVSVRWRTASEVELLGFNVYRQVKGRRVRVNTRVIAAHGAGAYAFLDRSAPRAGPLRYWVQAVNRDGSRRWFGPARVTGSS